MNIQEVKQQFKDEWVLLEVLQEDDLKQPIEVRVLTHSPNRDDVYDALLRVKEKIHVATMFTGAILKEGYAAAFFFLWE